MKENEVSSIAHIYILTQMTDRVNVGKRVTYVDSTMERVRVNNLGAILCVLQCPLTPPILQSATNSLHQSEFGRQLRQELAAARAELETKKEHPRFSKRN